MSSAQASRSWWDADTHPTRRIAAAGCAGCAGSGSGRCRRCFGPPAGGAARESGPGENPANPRNPRNNLSLRHPPTAAHASSPAHPVRLARPTQRGPAGYGGDVRGPSPATASARRNEPRSPREAVAFPAFPALPGIRRSPRKPRLSTTPHARALSNALASCKSAVSKPSVNQP